MSPSRASARSLKEVSVAVLLCSLCFSAGSIDDRVRALHKHFIKSTTKGKKINPLCRKTLLIPDLSHYVMDEHLTAAHTGASGSAY